MATSAEATPSRHPHRSPPAAAVLASPPSPAVQTLQLPPDLLAFGLSESFDGLDIDNSAASNNTTQSTPPQPAIALQPPSLQELPPLPSALQQPLSPDKREEECEEGAMGGAAKPDSVVVSPPATKSQCLKNSIGLLKQEMKNLRNADLTLLYQLNELHQQILAYKVAMNERLEHQSETNSEYSNSLTEDFEDFEDIDEENEEGLDYEPPATRVSDGLQALVLNGDSDERREGVNGPLQPQQQQEQQQQPPHRQYQLPPPQQLQQQLQLQPSHSPADRISHSASTALPHSSIPRSSLQQLRQRLPPPPPRPPAPDGRPGGNNPAGVHHWLDLNFQPDSYNC